jgi:alpha/beta superfamily hydrolase
LGYSLGTGLASKLAADSAPQQLILQAPFYSLTDIVRQRLFFIPPFILKYKFATNENLKDCNMPITIFHGNRDNVVNYKSSLKLKKEFNDRINLITLNGQGHNGITDNEDYKKELQHVLQ